MYSRYVIASLQVLFLACGLTCWCGCNRKKSIDLGEFGLVSGTVTHAGQPVKAGLITFHCLTSGQVATVNVRDGNYKMSLQGKNGLPLGNYVVSVRPPLARSQEHFRRKNVPENKTAANDYADIPEKYRYETSSGLSAAVKSGENTCDFELAN